ncbi:hypothetical protein ACX80E_09290 [Arthrobacter sp. TMN-49]
MISILQWTALVACLGCTLWRLPTMVKGRNRGLSWAFALITVSVALSIPAIYMPVDTLLGGVNLANAILRVSLFGVFFLLTSRVAAAYSSPLSRALIRGPVGIAVLVLSSLGIWITFLLSDLQGSSTGLAGFFDQPSVDTYMWIGVAYLAYASACVVVPTAKAAFSHRPPMDRVAASFLSSGFLLVCISAPLQLAAWHETPLKKIVSFTAVLSVAVGMVLVWRSLANLPAQNRARP